MKSIFLKKVKQYLLQFIAFIFPEKMLTTFFGIGYLPDWQNHWTAFFIIPVVGIAIHFAIGLTSNIVSLTFALLVSSAILFLLGLVSIYIFHATSKNYTKYEITIHVAFGQIFTLFLSVPAIVQFLNKIFEFNKLICTQFLFCADWFFYTATYFAAMLVPYFAFRIVDILKPWPSYILDRDYDHAFIYMSEQVFNAIYAAILMYLLAFLLLDLNILSVINLYKSLFIAELGSLQEIL